VGRSEGLAAPNLGDDVLAGRVRHLLEGPHDRLLRLDVEQRQQDGSGHVALDPPELLRRVRVRRRDPRRVDLDRLHKDAAAPAGPLGGGLGRLRPGLGLGFLVCLLRGRCRRRSCDLRFGD
jgi:hypothetical protein